MRTNLKGHRGDSGPYRACAIAWRVTWALALTVLAACASTRPAVTPQRLLFVGNSVLYTNNLPAVFSRVAESQPGGPAYQVDMFARGGASLSQWAADERLAAQLASGRYVAIVLQERGGDDLCVLDERDRTAPACQALVDSHLRLARLARSHGAQVIYLGTYQQMPAVSAALVRAEHALAAQMQARYVEVSEPLRALRAAQPGQPWLHADNAHPGVATTALMATLLYEALTGSAPRPTEVCTGAELYTPQWKQEGMAVHAQLVAQAGPARCLLNASQIRAIVQSSSGWLAPGQE